MSSRTASRKRYAPQQDDGSQSERQVNDRANQLYSADRPAHAWYRFVLSYPPHLVRDYVSRFGLTPSQRVLDPFCGTGTTLVECKKLGIPSLGIEANPMAQFASEAKVDWSPDPDALLAHAEYVAQETLIAFAAQGVADDLFNTNTNGHLLSELKTLPDEQMDMLLTNSISALPLHKSLMLLDALKQHQDARFMRHEMLALAKALVATISNLHFGPEVGVGPAKRDAPVVPAWLEQVREMCNDLRQLPRIHAPAQVLLGDSRHLLDLVEPNSIDAVITSPPYPNEKDYTRTTRLESVLLGLIHDKSDLKALKRGLIRSKLYFGGMLRHLADLRTVLRPGAHLAYVVGDQASYLRVMIRTGQILGQLAQSLGYELTSIDLFRTRLATATREQLREEVVVLRWPRKSKNFQVLSHHGERMPVQNRYTKIIEHIFVDNYVEGAKEVAFTRDDITRTAQALDIRLPKNLDDVIYSFRYRTTLPESVRTKAPAGCDWIIRPAGQAKYRFVAVASGSTHITPDPLQAVIKVPDATPGLIARYALTDEQALLAKVRYNRSRANVHMSITASTQNAHRRRRGG